MSANPSLGKSELLPPLDPLAAKRWERLAMHTPEAWLHEEVAKRMAKRLELIRCQPTHWVHWQPSLGAWSGQALVQQQYPQAMCTVVEADAQLLSQARQKWQPPWWKRVVTPAPLFAMAPKQPAQMLWANMGLHMQARPQASMAQWHLALAPEGFVMFSCLGPDTLHRLRALYAQQGWPPASHDFTDMHDWGDMLLASGFAQPVMDMERVTLTYTDEKALLAELRTLGRNLHPQRFAGLRGRQWLNTLHHGLRETLKVPGSSGRLALEFEIIYGHAFKVPAKTPASLVSEVTLDDLRSQLPSRRSHKPVT
ncbi:MAG: biotin synthase [Betaproteobacteria bacterium]|nr:biotin synthase [Betaproteobacteria bacterium]